jgi:AraC-like DNA-binding protein
LPALRVPEIPSRRFKRHDRIAACWRFASQAHFTRVFKAEYGITPPMARPLPPARPH